MLKTLTARKQVPSDSPLTIRFAAPDDEASGFTSVLSHCLGYALPVIA